GAENRRHLQELLFGYPADFLYHLRGIPGIKPFHVLKDALGVGQGGVGLGLFLRILLVAPGRRVISVLGFVITGKEAVIKTKVFIHQKGRVGVVDHVLLMVEIVLYDVV